ncbi:PiggyBac transposable element-derived protein 4-like [Plakobranchus ocellatus]|uniref:PiggyBac transposable element-derived protein 4-like n=1 Tax=Plakobranchus ocellatus TaxID=259542 RepID=A0AAV4CTD0_9GAST|nr:PiggyBac transposable element-derived protein 4-like [Plakobranchus ocellatus]
MELREVIKFEDPSTLKMVATASSSTSALTAPSADPPFISEVSTTGEGSDIENEEEEFVAVRSKYVMPVNRQPLHDDIEEDDNRDEEEEQEKEEAAVTTWREGTTAPAVFDFTGTSGLQVQMEGETPLDYLRLMVNDEMVESLVAETNRYASQTIATRQLAPKSRFHQWVETSVNEMWAFLGLIVAMGLIVIENLDEYWSIDQVYKLPFFGSVMPKDRFSLLLSFLHLANNKEQPPRDHPNHDPIFKIRPFIERLNANFKSVFLPGKNIAIDEAMVAWRGPLKFRVYNPDKPDKFGIKVFELCDGATAYCCNLEFYTGKREASVHGATFDVVERLINPYINCGRTLYVDNFYTSPDLFTYLKNHRTLACGTMRTNMKNGPPKELTPKFKKGDRSVNALTNGNLNYFRFIDRKEVRMLTTAHGPMLVTTGKTNPATKEAVIKLEAVHHYNQFMGTVDRSDQMVTNNAFKRRTLKWWKKAFFHMFMLGVLNAYIVHKATATRKLSHRIFRRDLAKQLVKFIPFCQEIRPAVCPGQSSLFRLTARHFPRFIHPKPGAKKQNPQRMCVVCSEPNKRTYTRYQCPSCDVGLHIDPCFEIYHTTKDFKRAHKRKLAQKE